MKIQDFLNSYDKLVKSAFVPNPQVQESQGQLEQAYAQLSQLMGSLPPETQQQVEPMVQQLQQLPPEEQLAQLNGIIQELSQSGQSGGEEQAPPQEGEAPPENEQGHLNAENSLDNTKVTLSVRELLDLSSGGKATQSLLKVKQMAEAHNKKMEATQQQAQQDQATAQQEQAAAQQGGMAQGGVYSQPMNTGATGG